MKRSHPTVADIAAYDTIIDVRSPAEFAEDHIPGAINCPVLDDEERIRVGTMYKQVSPFEAKKVGAALVSRNIARHLESALAGLPQSWRPLIYCWRGGQRSASLAHVLARVGWQVTLLDGGYKAFRRLVLDELEQLPARLQFRVLCGPTGSGKSRLLTALAAAGAQVLDLEALAAHRGSVLGDLPTRPQPSQRAFETALWQALQGYAPEQPVYVESESRQIGRLRVPEALLLRMRASPCVLVELATAERVRLLIEDYDHLVGDHAALGERLDALVPLHGHEIIGRWQDQARAGDWPGLVADLLAAHYDPAYRRSTGKNYVGLASARVQPVASAAADDFSAAARALLASAADAPDAA